MCLGVFRSEVQLVEAKHFARSLKLTFIFYAWSFMFGWWLMLAPCEPLPSFSGRQRL